jgi:hypothetical protein
MTAVKRLISSCSTFVRVLLRGARFASAPCGVPVSTPPSPLFARLDLRRRPTVMTRLERLDLRRFSSPIGSAVGWGAS